MNNLKKVLLFLFGVMLLIFGNKAAIDNIRKPSKKAEEKSMFKRINVDKSSSDLQSSKTSVEKEDAETASASE